MPPRIPPHWPPSTASPCPSPATAVFTWVIPCDCSSDAVAISSTNWAIFCEIAAFSLNASWVAFVNSLPLRTALIVFSIRLLVFFAASDARIARFRTSSATTAKPAPASPARAASTAAFRASRFVWKAISSIVLMIFPVSSLDSGDLAHGAGHVLHVPVHLLHNLIGLRHHRLGLIGMVGILLGHGRHLFQRRGGLLQR